MKRRARSRAMALAFAACCLLNLTAPRALAAADASAQRTAPRIEARSANLLAVGIVHDDRMAIHLSRLVDNSPVRDAALTVMLRGVVHPTIAEADGSYTLVTKDLQLPGTAALVFQVAEGGGHDELKGAFQLTADAAKPEDKNSVRQLAWWVLNFAVCIGFLMLWNRRRKPAED